MISCQCKLSSNIGTIFFSDPRVLIVESQAVLKPDQVEFVLSEGMLNNHCNYLTLTLSNIKLRLIFAE